MDGTEQYGEAFAATVAYSNKKILDAVIPQIAQSRKAVET
jgi:hypothetical protein